MKKVFIASDHAGFKLKKSILEKYSRSNKFVIFDIGPVSDVKSVDYPYFAHKVSKKVASNTKNIGILVCGSGLGMSMAANKHKKIRAALCYSVKNAKLSRLHNNANIITLGSRLIKKNLAFSVLTLFLKQNLKAEDTKKE